MSRLGHELPLHEISFPLTPHVSSSVTHSSPTVVKSARLPTHILWKNLCSPATRSSKVRLRAVFTVPLWSQRNLKYTPLLGTTESACRLRCSAAQWWIDDRWQTDRQDEHTRYWWYCWSPELQVRIFSFSDRFSMCELFSYLWLVIWWKQKGKSLFSFISICEKSMFCLFHGISCRFCEWNIVRIKSGRMFAFSCENISFCFKSYWYFFYFFYMISQMENRLRNFKIISCQNVYSRQITIHKHRSNNN